MTNNHDPNATSKSFFDSDRFNIAPPVTEEKIYREWACHLIEEKAQILDMKGVYSRVLLEYLLANDLDTDEIFNSNIHRTIKMKNEGKDSLQRNGELFKEGLLPHYHY